MTLPRLAVLLGIVLWPALSAPPPAGALAPGWAGVDPVLVSGADPFSSCPDSGPGTVFPGAAVEPMIAANPRTRAAGARNLIAVWQQDRWDRGGSRGIMVATSFDGGRSWSAAPLPFSRCAPDGLDYDRASDPWVSFDPDGTAYVTALALTLAPGPRPDATSTRAAAVVAVSSHDGGRTWSRPVLVTTEQAADKDMVVADPLHAGRADATWQQVTGEIMLSSTVDGGRSWSPPRAIVASPASPPRAAGQNELLVDARRHLLDDVFELTRFYQSGEQRCRRTHGRLVCHRVGPDGEIDSRVAMVRSADGGRTWSSPRLIAQDRLGADPPVCTPDSGLRTGKFIPSAAMDPASGTLYVVWQDGDRGPAYPDRVVLSRSLDGGRTWSRPQAVSRPANRFAFTPTVAVDGRGRVGLSYYVLAAPGSSLVDYALVSSGDRGAHFGPPVRLAGPLDLTAAAAQCFLGDYEGLAGLPRGFQALYAVPTGTAAERASAIMTAQLSVPNRRSAEERRPRSSRGANR